MSQGHTGGELIDVDFGSKIVNRLFSASLPLAGAESLLQSGPASERVSQAIDEFDSVIREVRAALFAARHAVREESSLHNATPEPGYGDDPLLQLAVVAHGGSTLVRLRGELDAATAPGLQDVLTGIIARDEKDLILDCRRLTFADVRGFRVIEEAAQQMKADSGRLRLRGLTPTVERLVQVLEELFLPEPPWTVEK